MAEPQSLETPFKTKEEKEKWLSPGWFLNQSRNRIKKMFGADYDPEKLLDLLKRICGQQPLTDDEVLDLVEMFLYYMESGPEPWTIGPQLYRHWLGVGARSNSQLILPNSHLTASGAFRSSVCSSHWPIIERAISERVADTTNSVFPRDRETGQAVTQTFEDEFGNPITVQSQPSPLRGGGTEVIYYEKSIAVSKTEQTELAMTFGGVAVVSKVTVTSQTVHPGEWLIEITDWTCWAWDDGDFNADKTNTQYLPFNISDIFPVEWIKKKALKMVEERYGISRRCLEEPMAYDEYMRQLEGKTISRTSVVTGQPVTYYPKDFKIYFSSWDFFTVHAACAPPRTYTITE